ncbi:MAG: hypothetical protein FWC68_04210, partial [Oscillospiraceae bacterium]|nr:hypothetical protein [Oscillospiraceae bacterium]
IREDTVITVQLRRKTRTITYTVRHVFYDSDGNRIPDLEVPEERTAEMWVNDNRVPTTISRVGTNNPRHAGFRVIPMPIEATVAINRATVTSQVTDGTPGEAQVGHRGEIEVRYELITTPLNIQSSMWEYEEETEETEWIDSLYATTGVTLHSDGRDGTVIVETVVGTITVRRNPQNSSLWYISATLNEGVKLEDGVIRAVRTNAVINDPAAIPGLFEGSGGNRTFFDIIPDGVERSMNIGGTGNCSVSFLLEGVSITTIIEGTGVYRYESVPVTEGMFYIRIAADASSTIAGISFGPVDIPVQDGGSFDTLNLPLNVPLGTYTITKLDSNRDPLPASVRMINTTGELVTDAERNEARGSYGYVTGNQIQVPVTSETPISIFLTMIRAMVGNSN